MNKGIPTFYVLDLLVFGASTTSHASADLNEKNKGFLFSVYRLTGNS
jgi:hypothetical protein|nr:MAG TPA: hypothetical protein [Caudoviricetes sp.]